MDEDALRTDDPADIIRALLVGGNYKYGTNSPFYDDAKDFGGSNDIRCNIKRRAFEVLCERFVSGCDKAKPEPGAPYSHGYDMQLGRYRGR